MRVCVCAFPFDDNGFRIHLCRFVEILKMSSDSVYWIFNGMPDDKELLKDVEVRDLHFKAHYVGTITPRWYSVLLWILKYILIQIIMIFQVLWVAGKVDIFIFHFGPHYTPAILLARLLGKKTLKIFLVPSSKELVYSKTSPIYYIGLIMDKLNCIVCHWLLLGSEYSVRLFEMEKYRRKIVVSGYQWSYPDEGFKEIVPWEKRQNVVGYVGRLRHQKGVLEFIRAVPLILKRKKDVRFLVVGDGELKDQMKQELKDAGCLDKVEFTGVVSIDKVPDLMNQMKFHICPSHFELVGAVNEEAMLCGTIAIANTVGGVPDMVIDNKTGFLLKNNNPQTIADKVFEVWDSPELPRIRKNSAQFIIDNFSREVAVKYWQENLPWLSGKEKRKQAGGKVKK